MLSLKEILELKNDIKIRDELINSLEKAEIKIKDLEKKISQLTNTNNDLNNIKSIKH